MKRAPVYALLWLATVHLAGAAELLDPTRPVVPPATVTTPSGESQPKLGSALRLEGILVAEQRRIAIINGKLLHVGDWLGDIQVRAIATDAVHYSRAGRSLTLRLTAPTIKVRRTAASQKAKQ